MTGNGELDEDEPGAPREEKARQGRALVAPAVEPGAGAGEEEEGRRTEVRDPAREEDARRRSTGRDPREDPDVVNGHQHHDCAADDVERRNAVSLHAADCREFEGLAVK
jgi:hypothetical protein